MDSRRNVLKKMLVGTATAAVVPGTASAALQAVAPSAENAGRSALSRGLPLPAGAAPWWLVAPLAVGSPLKYGWYVADLGAVERGAAVLTLAHTNGKRAKLHLCGHAGNPRGVAHSDLLDLVLMDGGSGSFRTDEKLGRVVLGLADLVRRNELRADADMSAVANMMSHEERVGAFGPESLV
jgi:hypothetical protein